MKKARWLPALLLILALALPLAAGAQAMDGPEADLGLPMADFTVDTIDGGTFTLSETLKEKDLVLINLWATWCGPCQREFPFMEAAYEQYRDRVEVIALSVEPGDTVAKLNEFVKTMGMTFPVGRDTLGLGDRYALEGIPTSLAVDRFGNLAWMEVGSQPDTASFTRLFDYFLSEDYTETRVLIGLPPAKPTVSAASAGEMAAALNVPGGELVFRASEDPYAWPFIPDNQDGRDCLVSTNTEQSGSNSAVYTTVKAAAGDMLAFAFKTSSEDGFDFLRVSVNGETRKSFSGETGWREWALALPEGESEIAFYYVKDGGEQLYDDRVWIDDVRVLSAEEAAPIVAAMPVYPTAEENTLTPLSPDAREIVFNDPEGFLAEVFGSESYWIVPGGTVEVGATITGEVDVDMAVIFDNCDSSVVRLAEIIPAEGSVYRTVCAVDSMDETGYPYSTVCLYADASSKDLVNITVMRDEENVNTLVDLVAKEGVTVSWTYADGAEPGTASAAEGEAASLASYQMYFVDQNGDAVPGCIINFCTDETCVPCVADAEGVASFEGEPYPYHLQVIRVPQGYSFDTAQEFTAPAEGGEMTFTVNKD